MLRKLEFYTDGAFSSKTEMGGWASICLEDEMIIDTKTGYEPYSTNNRMEPMAAIAALEALIRPCQVDLYSDSSYLVNAFNQHWIESWEKKGWKRGKNEEVKNQDLWKRLLAAAAPHTIRWHWVKGHNGHPLNERCDELATAAADGNQLIADPGASER